MKTLIVACPGDCVTGGPELLHQLVCEVNRLGGEAKMLYLPTSQMFAVPDQYLDYCSNSSRATAADLQRSDVLLVVPETLIELSRVCKGETVIWWQSVDNYLGIRRENIFKNTVGFLWALWRRKGMGLRNIRHCRHLYQSEFAHRFLERHGIDSQPMGDYLTSAHLCSPASRHERKDLVLYNPLKGMRHTALLRAHTDFEWRPIQGLTPQGVSELLRSAKLYVDFGNHPGKDRLPREAALAGCCVITGLKGSAAFQTDVDIPTEFKLNERSDLFVQKFIRMANQVFSDFEGESSRFDGYREKIRAEQGVFLAQVEKFVRQNRLLG